MDDSVPFAVEAVMKTANALLTALVVWSTWRICRMEELFGKKLSYWQAFGITIIVGCVIYGQLWIYDKFH